MTLVVFTMVVPCAIAVAFGLRGRKDKPRTPRDFFIGAAWVLGWTFGSVMLWQGIWISAQGATGNGSTIGVAFYWALISAALWVPVLMITYVLSAQRAIKAEDRTGTRE